MSSWHSYPKIYNIGHRVVRGILTRPVQVEEKIDGSQFSFGVFDGELKCKSKGKKQYPQTDKMFDRAIEQVLAVKDRLMPGWTYSGEYLSRPKHNTIAYERVPFGNIAIFDIRVDDEDYLSHAAKHREAHRIGFECVRLLHDGVITREIIEGLLQNNSALGGSKIEGVVLKDYSHFDPSGKAIMAKYVSEAFKEKNDKSFRKRNPTGKDQLGLLCDRYRSEARWEKARQHLRENGQLSDDPRDIPTLVKEVQRDLHEEEADEIKEHLFKWAWKHVGRKSVAGLAEWYKQKLLEEAFSEEA
jgi:hypothetical protein